MNQKEIKFSEAPMLDEASAIDILSEKLADAQISGYRAEFAPDEAEQAGAFIEDAMSESDAEESALDLIDVPDPGDEKE